MSQDKHIDYIEFQVGDVARAKTFYGAAFGWTFKDYGPTYSCFEGAGMRGGFEQAAEPKTGGPLVVLYAEDLAASEAAVTGAGGRIVKEVFEFPGGRRFHFADTEGNELAVWSDR